VIEVGREVFEVRGIVAFSGGAKYANTIAWFVSPIQKRRERKCETNHAMADRFFNPVARTP
jgi:hypothetical protein